MNITISVPDSVITQADYNAHVLHMKRSEYIRKAIEYMNRQTLKETQYARLQFLSQKVMEESMNVNAEFEAIEYDPKT